MYIVHALNTGDSNDFYTQILSHTDESCKDETRVCGYKKESSSINQLNIKLGYIPGYIIRWSLGKSLSIFLSISSFSPLEDTK